MTRTVNIGETLIDEIAHPNSESVEVVGGSMLNVTAGPTRFGHRPELATRFARGARGGKVCAHAEVASIVLTLGSDGAEFATVAHAVVNERGHITYEFDLSWGVPAAGDPNAVGHVHTGSYVVAVEPGADKALAAVKHQVVRGIVSYDSNIHPVLLGTLDEARLYIEAIVAPTDVIKALDEDLEWLYLGHPVEDVIREWSQSGSSLILCMRGPWGVYIKAATERGILVVDSLDIEPVDTVGVGSSLMTGLISGFVNTGLLGFGEVEQRLRKASRGQILSAIHRGIITSGITTLYQGACPPAREEVADVLAADPTLRG